MSEKYDDRDGSKLLRSNWRLLEDPWKSDQAQGVAAPDQEEGPREGENGRSLIPASEI